MMKFILGLAVSAALAATASAQTGLKEIQKEWPDFRYLEPKQCGNCQRSSRPTWRSAAAVFPCLPGGMPGTT